MDQALKVVGVLIAAAAVAVGGWIGYRATDSSPEFWCFKAEEISEDGKGEVVCIDPSQGTSTYRWFFVSDGEVGRFPR